MNLFKKVIFWHGSCHSERSFNVELELRRTRRLKMEKVYSSSIDSADIVVGIPSYNEADNIAFVVEQCRLGLLKYFPFK